MRRSSRTTWLLRAAAPSLLAACALLPLGCSQKDGGGWGGPSGPQLVAMAQDTEDADRRREGINELSKKDWGLREPYLSWYANRLEVDKVATVRSAAARALGRSGAAQYLSNLATALGDPSPVVRLDVAVALDHVLGESAVEALRKTAAQDGSPDVRAAAAKALKHYPLKTVVRTLVYCLSDQSFEVRYWSHDSLVALVSKDLGYEPADWAPVLGEGAQPAPPDWRRPWWDWFGTSKPKSPAFVPASQPAPAIPPRPASAPASAPAK
jgi:hypothetical protein